MSPFYILLRQEMGDNRINRFPLTTYIIRRFLFLAFVLFGVSVLIFSILMTFSPERRAMAYVKSPQQVKDCLLYTSDAADEVSPV